VLSSWFDRLTTIGFFPNVLSKVEGQAQGERFFAFCEGREALGLQCLFNDGPIHKPPTRQLGWLDQLPSQEVAMTD
jgi:hypothetical protein